MLRRPLIVLALLAATGHAEAAKKKAPAPVKKAPVTRVAESDPAPPSPPVPILAPLPPERDMPVAEAPRPPRRFLTVTLNPLPMVAGRYGANVEFVPHAHHAIVGNVYWQSLQPWVLDAALPKEVQKGSPPGALGGELGYRLYSGSDGAHGLFVGPSLIAMPLVYPRVTEQLRAEVVPITAYGASIDIGAQAILGSGFTIGGGIGVMGLAYTPPASVKPPPGVDAPTFIEPHVLPRLLLAAGWSF